VVELLLFLCACLSVFVTVAIVGILVVESGSFFVNVSVVDFLTDIQWTPLFSHKHFGILPLVSGTFLVAVIAMVVALPAGLVISVYLSEYAPLNVRRILMPTLETLTVIPTVVYGYFALLLITPILQEFLVDLGRFNALSAGFAMGVMILPMVSTLSERAIRAVPVSLREAAFALGSTKMQTSFRVVVPAAFSGISASFLLGLSRAVGETMIVTIAAGQQPRLSANPLNAVETMTAYIIQVGLGDIPAGSAEYRTIFVVGTTLFLITSSLNLASHRLMRRFGETYR
jgi:phosphate transport system permease protein